MYFIYIEKGDFHKSLLQNLAQNDTSDSKDSLQDSMSFKAPDDYKFHCFGEEIFVQVDTDRFTNHTRTIFNDKWEKMPFEILYKNPNYTPQKPKNFESMSNIAMDLGSVFGGVRVDLYNIDGATKVGEITFTHGGGTEAFNPKEWDKKLGDLWEIKA